MSREESSTPPIDNQAAAVEAAPEAITKSAPLIPSSDPEASAATEATNAPQADAASAPESASEPTVTNSLRMYAAIVVLTFPRYFVVSNPNLC